MKEATVLLLVKLEQIKHLHAAVRRLRPTFEDTGLCDGCGANAETDCVPACPVLTGGGAWEPLVGYVPSAAEIAAEVGSEPPSD